MADVVRRRVVVDGRVQGVSYRVACARVATGAGVSGWVRNLADGRVEAVLEGDAASVEQVVAWCGEGPPLASVDSVEVIDEPPTGDRVFRIA